MSLAKWQPSCLGLNALMQTTDAKSIIELRWTSMMEDVHIAFILINLMAQGSIHLFDNDFQPNAVVLGSNSDLGNY